MTSMAPEGLERPAEVRDQAGRQRDVAAQLRDRAGLARDRAADERDQLADRRDHAESSESLLRARRVSAALPDSSCAEPTVSDRERSSEDRAAGAGDRIDAELDRTSALADRLASAQDRRQAAVDRLTGVYTRDAGLVELERDLARVRRTGQGLVLAFVDVDHLKVINDALGHAAGDRLLLGVASTLQSALRPYDLIIRYGGDEFLCAVQGIDALIARPRFARVNVLLAGAPEHGSVTVGLAEFQPDESSSTLIARADADLYRQREKRSD
jgi:diguanylate cyclase (GGDEF)-like protein